MKRCLPRSEGGNILITTLCTMLILSMIGANVLMNCTTRYNVTSKQVKAWKSALVAAEAGGDVAYATIRKTLAGGTGAFTTAGWTASGSTWTKQVTGFGENNSLSASIVVDNLPVANISPAPSPGSNHYYRVRSTGTSLVSGLKRTGMDDRMDATTKGDSLLRKIDFNYDHFIAAYGANGDGVGAQVTAVASPKVSRRIELITVPVARYEVAIKAGGTFEGLGNAAYIDSFRSSNGAYNSSVKTDPTSPRYVDSRSGSVQINAATAQIRGDIYGNVYTNHGTVTGQTNNIVSPGIVDNNIAFDPSPAASPIPATTVANPSFVSGNVTITGSSTNPDAPNVYHFSSFSSNANLTVNGVAGGQTTYVSVVLDGDFGSSSGQGPSLTTASNVVLNFYYSGNWQTKAASIQNNSGLAANLQFLNTSTSSTTIDINSGGSSSVGFAAVFYAPYADMTVNGAPDITGSVNVHNFYANGNVHWHYDRDLINGTNPVDYRVASYVEDIR